MNLKKELPILAVVSMPFIYLAYIWTSLPGQVPLHWNIQGEIDRYGGKSELILIPLLLPLLIYLIFLIVPKIDPKSTLNKMGGKFQTIQFSVTAFMSVLAMIILYSVQKKSLLNPNYIVLSIGFLFIILGNFFQTIKPNYFIGIRTPWTLESEKIWKETHRLGGKLWFVGGILIVILSLVLDSKQNFIAFMIITGLISIIPILFSYLMFRKEIKTN